MLETSPLGLYIVVANTFCGTSNLPHVSKLKASEDKNILKIKQTYHLSFDLIGHRFIGEVKCVLGVK